MRVVLVTHGTDGDTRPMVALAKALIGAGHEPRLLVERSGAELAARHGVPAEPLAGELGPPAAQLAAHEVSHCGGLRTAMTAFRDLVRAHLGDWMSHTAEASRGAHLVVSGPLTMAAGLGAAEAHGIPGVGAPLQPQPGTGTASTKSRVFSRRAGGHTHDGGLWRLLEPVLNPAREALGLEPLTGWRHDYPALGAWSPHILPRPHDWRPDHHVVGEWRLSEPEWTMPEDLAAFIDDGEPPVYVGFGNAAPSPEVVQGVLEGLGDRRAIVAHGGNDALMESLPDTAFPIESAPHEHVFPRMACLVHACGAGTAHASVRAGVGVVPVPLGFDQPLWADCLHRLGVSTRPVEGGRVDPPTFSRWLDLASSSTFRRKADAVAARMRGDEGTTRAVSILESLAPA